MRALLFEPFDSCFFRDPRPFDQSDAGLSEAASQFPPPPATIFGAVCAAIAAGLDPPPTDNWAQDSDAGSPARNAMLDRLKATVGLAGGSAPLNIVGPFLFDVPSHKLHLPAPSTWRLSSAGQPGKQNHEGRFLLPRRTGKGLRSDLGTTFLPPEPVRHDAVDDETTTFDPLPGGGVVPADMFWNHLFPDTSRPGWRRLARPVRLYDDIAPAEARVGLAIDPEAARAVAGQLYSAAHRRLDSAWRIGAFIIDTDAGETAPAAGIPFGGEGRVAGVKAIDSEWPAPRQADVQNWCNKERGRDVFFRLVALTPMPMGDGSGRLGLPGAGSDDILAGAEAVSAVAHRPVTSGYWPAAGAGAPRLFRAFPAGDTWFLKARLPRGRTWLDAFQALIALSRTARLGPDDLTRRGYGAFAIGAWPDF